MKLSHSWFAVDQAVSISLEESAHPEFSGRIVELCATGIRLRTNRALRRGSALQLTWKSTIVVAEVQSCFRAQSDFLVEVELECAFYRNQNRRQRMALA